MEIHLYELQLILSFWEEKFFESIVQMKFLLKNILWMNCLIEWTILLLSFIWITTNIIILRGEFFWINRSNEIFIEKYLMNELFDWMNYIITIIYMNYN